MFPNPRSKWWWYCACQVSRPWKMVNAHDKPSWVQCDVGQVYGWKFAGEREWKPQFLRWTVRGTVHPLTRFSSYLSPHSPAASHNGKTGKRPEPWPFHRIRLEWRETAKNSVLSFPTCAKELAFTIRMSVWCFMLLEDPVCSPHCAIEKEYNLSFR